jgi:hypothetical protein
MHCDCWPNCDNLNVNVANVAGYTVLLNPVLIILCYLNNKHLMSNRYKKVQTNCNLNKMWTHRTLCTFLVRENSRANSRLPNSRLPKCQTLACQTLINAHPRLTRALQGFIEARLTRWGSKKLLFFYLFIYSLTYSFCHTHKRYTFTQRYNNNNN